MNPIVGLFSVAWGTVSLVELLWTIGALAGMLLAFWKIWRSYGRARRLSGRTQSQPQRYVNQDILFRHVMLGVVLEVAFWLGLWSMAEPQAPGVTSSAAIAGLAFWLVELAIIAAVLHEEWTYWRVQWWFRMVGGGG